MKAMIYLDANIFVYAAINNGPLGEKCRKILLEVSQNKFAGYTSVLTWDEVVHSIWKKEGKIKALEQGRNFLRLPNILFLDATQSIISRSQELMKKYGLKPRDAIHAATALDNNIIQMVSDDSDFNKIREIKRAF
jgi:predicted nucleic acid-binding protein